MNTETQVAPDVATQNPASEPAQETPEVAAPETQAEESEPQSADTEASRAEKAAKALERRLGKRTADLHRERAQREQLEQELAAFKAQGTQEQQPDPVKLAEQLVERKELVGKVQSILAEGKKLDGFDRACNFINEEIPFYDAKGAPTPFLRVVMEADAPHAVLHHLGNNPDLVEELADLSPTQQARRLDRLERELAAKPKTSAAPKPLTPVKASASESELHSGLSDAEWIRRREAQLRAERKRI